MTPDELDHADPLAMFRDEFVLPEGVIYLLGHSLGPAPRAALAAVRQAAEGAWAKGLAASWNDAGWFTAQARIGAKIAGLIGAQADEVIVADSVTVNLFSIALSAARASGRKVILAEAHAFPTDLYALASAAAAAGCSLRTVAAADLADFITADVGVVLIQAVDFRSGARADLAGLCAKARAAGAFSLVDLAHATGAMAIDLAGLGADFAAGCGYKYLSGGPGAPAFLFVRRGLHDLAPGVQGWLGHADAFAFEPRWRAGPGAAAWATGTPPILSLAALEAAIDLHANADSAVVEAKTRSLQDVFRAALGQDALALLTPLNARGGHLAFRFEAGFALVQALKARGVHGDFRAPDVVRFGFGPLYLSHAEAARAGEIVEDVLMVRAYDDLAFHSRARVT
ncbi:MAG: aminotransferase class V-fold PLP-dependent enzyme [Caulobacterales bacterium]|jgi:kynureninase